MRWRLDTMGCLASRKRTHALGFRTRLSQDSGEVRFDAGNYGDSEFHRLPCANAFAPRVKLTVLQQAQLQAGVLRTANPEISGCTANTRTETTIIQNTKRNAYAPFHKLGILQGVPVKRDKLYTVWALLRTNIM